MSRVAECTLRSVKTLLCRLAASPVVTANLSLIPPKPLLTRLPPYLAPATILILSLSGCGSILPAIPSVLKIPVAVPCADAVPARPKLATDQELMALDDYRLILTLRSDGIKARDHIGVLEATLQACVK